MIDLCKIEKEIYLNCYPKNKKYIFYYDETNNYRKIKINNHGLNNKKSLFYNFILGGICFEKNVCIENLFKNLRIASMICLIQCLFNLTCRIIIHIFHYGIYIIFLL